MPEIKYQKPKDKVTFVYRGKELLKLLEQALSKCQGKPSSKSIIRQLSALSGGGSPVLIIEQMPLGALSASGKVGDLIYARINKTATQYVKKYKKPKNPRTPAQIAIREKLKNAVLAWRKLSDDKKEKYNQRASRSKKPISGYNLFVSEYIKGLKN